MKIAILVGLFPPRWLAGTELGTYNIAKHLAKRGHEIHVITSLDEGLPKESVEQGFYVHRIGFPKIRFLRIVVFWLKALLLLKRLNSDIVHAQSTLMGIVGFLAKKLLEKPYIIYWRGSESYLPWLFKEPISKLILRAADAALALTEDMKTEMQKICSRDVNVIPNGIDLESFEDLPIKEAIRGRLGLNNDDNLILFVGTFRPVKGLRYLIQAMNIIKQKGTSMRLMLVGYGKERDYLKSLIEGLNLEGYVAFAGKVLNEKVPQYMAAADILVLPSLSEGFPVTILEAMASGLPIVATRVGGLPEIIKDEKNGFLVEPANPEQIADKVLTLLADVSLRQKMSETNRNKVQQYSWQNTVGQLEAIYRRVLKDTNKKTTCINSFRKG